MLAAILNAGRHIQKPPSAHDQLTPTQRQWVDEQLREREERQREWEELSDEERAKRLDEQQAFLESLFGKKR